MLSHDGLCRASRIPGHLGISTHFGGNPVNQDLQAGLDCTSPSEYCLAAPLSLA